jgi:hypothetical protein
MGRGLIYFANAAIIWFLFAALVKLSLAVPAVIKPIEHTRFGLTVSALVLLAFAVWGMAVNGWFS